MPLSSAHDVALTVERRTVARLLLAPLVASAGPHSDTGTPFSPGTYTYLPFALSVLVTAPERLMLSQLVADLRAAVVDAGIQIADTGRQAGR
ncbi:DUF2398 family protein [Streptomyces rubrogriseus]|uniref:DUF2398 family protein n=1 Tax=Streptomyces rubrogriseus TaxID=194673 RepID=UPI00382A416A